eukprot:TRINITY_DN7132_c0_g2_i1.p1 TRINITY_DN7132_c0_g2~~TRINITY_DN7132_c0_g2_i1.p1  ORF type:complete len:210 (-),score=55.75 TRINITY_DN7132_c0_g2_i1:516-1145(-)
MKAATACCFGFARKQAESLLDVLHGEGKRLQLRADIASAAIGHAAAAAAAQMAATPGPGPATLASALQAIGKAIGPHPDGPLHFSGQGCELRLWPSMRFDLAYQAQPRMQPGVHLAGEEDAGLARFARLLDQEQSAGRWKLAEGSCSSLQMELDGESDEEQEEAGRSDQATVRRWISNVLADGFSLQLPRGVVTLVGDDVAALCGLHPP